MKLWEADHKGDVHSYPGGMSLTCGGKYFDWPWWKRRLSDITHRPYATYRGLRGVAWRLGKHPHLLFKWHNHEDGGYAPLTTMYGISYSLGSSHIKPIYWAVDLSEYKKRKAEELA